MILKALYDYYKRCDNSAPNGYEYRELGFLIVISKEGEFRRIEDCRIDKKHCKVFLVPQTVTRSGSKAGMLPCLMWDNVNFVLGVQRGDTPNPEGQYIDAFRLRVKGLSERYTDRERITAVSKFYGENTDVLSFLKDDPLYDEIVTTNKGVSFRLEGDTKIVAEDDILRNELSRDNETNMGNICMVTGKRAEIARIHHKTPLPGAAFASLISFQKSSGFDSYGKEQAFNAPISVEAEFAYTSALNNLLGKDSRNKFSIGERTFLFWASNSKESSKRVEESVFDFLGFAEDENNDPNRKIEEVKRVFYAIYSGQIQTDLNDKFYILGLTPNSARIAVVYWKETSLMDFAAMILKHFMDMEIVDCRRDGKPYVGLYEMLTAVTLNSERKNITPNLPEALTKSIFEGCTYPETLFSSCIRRIRAEQNVISYGSPCRMAILKAYLNRLNDNKNKNIEIMLDKENTNEGYLCGRLFAVLENLQYAANKQDSIRSSYMNAASSTPSAVFSTILKLSNTHYGKLAKEHKGLAIYFDRQKEEILSILGDFPDTLELKDQGRFFLGYYHQKNIKENKENEL